MDNNEYESYEGDSYEGGEDQGDFDFDTSGDDDLLVDNADTEIEAIARLISDGDSEMADALAAQREKTGARSKTVRQSVNLDAHGNKMWHQSSTPDPEPESKGDAPETIYGTQVRDYKNHAEREFHAAHEENQRLQDMFEKGEIGSAQELYNLQYQQGVRAAQAKEAMMVARIQELELGNQQAEVHRQLEEVLGKPWSAEQRKQTMEDMVAWGRSKNLPDDLLAGIESADEAKALYDAMDNERKLEAAQIELKAAKAMLKKQNAQLKGRRVKQRKDANIGQRSESTVDQVAQLLAENGITGRR